MPDFRTVNGSEPAKSPYDFSPEERREKILVALGAILLFGTALIMVLTACNKFPVAHGPSGIAKPWVNYVVSTTFMIISLGLIFTNYNLKQKTQERLEKQARDILNAPSMEALSSLKPNWTLLVEKGYFEQREVGFMKDQITQYKNASVKGTFEDLWRTYKGQMKERRFPTELALAGSRERLLSSERLSVAS